MALDQTANFVRIKVSGTYTSSDTTISLASGDASELPDPANGEYNLVWWDDTNNSSPATDPEVEIVRVTNVDTTNDEIAVQRGQEDTSAVAHDTADATYRMILAPTSKMFGDINDVTNLSGSAGTAGQFLQTDGTNLSFADISGGMTEKERRVFNDLVVQLARNDFADNLSEMAYDGGFFDIFKDTSKIASSSQLNFQTLSGGDTVGKVKIDQSGATTGITQTSTGQANSFNYHDDSDIEFSGSANSTMYITQVECRPNRDKDKKLRVYAGGEEILTKDISGFTEREVNTFNIDTSDYSRPINSGENWQVVVGLEAERSLSNTSVNTTSEGIYDNFSISPSNLFQGENATYVTAEEVEINSTGSLTWNQLDLSQDDFSNPPSSVVFSNDVDIPSGSQYNVYYLLTDGDGNTKTLTQGDEDTEVDLSNFTSRIIDIKAEFEADTLDTPTLNDFSSYFREG